MIRSTSTTARCMSLALALLSACVAEVLAGPEQSPPVVSNEPLTTAHASPEADGIGAGSEPAAAAPRPLPPRSAPRDAPEAGGNRRRIAVPGGVWRTIGSLGLIIGIIFALRGLMTRFGGPLHRVRAPSGIIEVLGRFPLARGQAILLLKVDRRILVVCQAGGSVSTLSEITDAEQVASLLQHVRHERGDSFTRQFESLITPVRERGVADGSSREESPVIVDLTRADRSTLSRRIGRAFGSGGGR